MAAYAGVAELCDRVKYNVWSDDLSGILSPPRTPLLFNFGTHIEEVPKYFVGPYTIQYAQAYEEFQNHSHLTEAYWPINLTGL